MRRLAAILIGLAWFATACGGAGRTPPTPTSIPLPTAIPSPTVVTYATATSPANNQPQAGQERTSPADGMVQIYIPQGTFTRGGIDSDARANEGPAAKITMSGFWIDKTEVTNGMYRLCVEAGVCELPHYGSRPVLKSQTRDPYFNNPEFADYPVIYVTWGDADTYCKWAGRRLPTEAEWEYAARGAFPSLNIFPWGDQRPDSSRANFNYAVGDTTRVGSYPAGASPFGVLDMAGNVAEWVNDFYDPNYYQQSTTMNPTGPAGRTNLFARVVRGGHWGDSWQALRVSARASLTGPNPNAQMGSDQWYGESAPTVGFRCASSQ